MNAKQNIVFFIGVILIIMVFWVNDYWKILHDTIATPSSSPLPGSKGGTIIKPGGKCPPGYLKIGNMCLPPNSLGPGYSM